VPWHELGEVENECTSYNFRLFAIFVQKIVRFGESLTVITKIFLLVCLRHSVDTDITESRNSTATTEDSLAIYLSVL